LYNKPNLVFAWDFIHKWVFLFSVYCIVVLQQYDTTIKLWNQLAADVLTTYQHKPHSFRKRVRKVYMEREVIWVMKCLKRE